MEPFEISNVTSLAYFEAKRFAKDAAFESYDVIRRAHVSREPENQRAVGRCTEWAPMGCFVPPLEEQKGPGGEQPVSVFAQILGRGCVAVTELLDTDPFVANLVLPKIKLFQRLGG